MPPNRLPSPDEARSSAAPAALACGVCGRVQVAQLTRIVLKLRWMGFPSSCPLPPAYWLARGVLRCHLWGSGKAAPAGRGQGQQELQLRASSGYLAERRSGPCGFRCDKPGCDKGSGSPWVTLAMVGLPGRSTEQAQACWAGVFSLPSPPCQQAWCLCPQLELTCAWGHMGTVPGAARAQHPVGRGGQVTGAWLC